MKFITGVKVSAVISLMAAATMQASWLVWVVPQVTSLVLTVL
jgi:hypothetical protein